MSNVISLNSKRSEPILTIARRLLALSGDSVVVYKQGTKDEGYWRKRLMRLTSGFYLQSQDGMSWQVFEFDPAMWRVSDDQEWRSL